jgi:hypothetical protein
MTKARKTGVIIAVLFAAFAVVAAVYFLLPTAPKTIEGAWLSEDGLVVGTYEGGTGRQFMEATYGENNAPDQTFKYAVKGNAMRISDGKEASGKAVSLPPMTLAMKFSNGNRVVTMYDGDLRTSSVYRLGSPEAKLVHLGNNWFK